MIESLGKSLLVVAALLFGVGASVSFRSGAWLNGVLNSVIAFTCVEIYGG